MIYFYSTSYQCVCIHRFYVERFEKVPVKSLWLRHLWRMETETYQANKTEAKVGGACASCASVYKPDQLEPAIDARTHGDLSVSAHQPFLHCC